MMHADAFTISFLLLLTAVLAVGLMRRIGAPPLLGYLAAGLVLGPGGIGLVREGAGMNFLAELGVILLMFMAGLEFSLPRMLAARTAVFGGGGLQVGLTTLLVAATLHLLAAAPLVPAVLIGGAVAMSSTALSLKQLAEVGELDAQHGRLAVGVLLFQDLATLPFLVLVAAGPGTDDAVGGGHLLRQMGIAGGALLVLGILLRPLLRRFLLWVARARSNELFLLAAFLLALGTAYAAHLVGLSPALGAFFGGMVVGESDFRHEVEDDLRPFRDLLLGIFFISIGMMVEPVVLRDAPLAVLAWLSVLTIGKAVVVMAAGRLVRLPADIVRRLGLVLAHGGEFGLLILTQGSDVGLIDDGWARPLLAALVLSMAVAPFLIRLNGRIAAWSSKRGHEQSLDAAMADARAQADLRDHVLLLGCGRVGRLVALVLEAADLPCLAIESDIDRVRRARRQGLRVLYGDARRRRLLDAAGLTHARLVLLTFDTPDAVARIIRHVRARRPDLPVLASASDTDHLDVLTEAGAHAVFVEAHAAGLALADETLVFAGLEREQAATIVAQVRATLNPELAGHLSLSGHPPAPR